jgi:hypothetical protein
MKRRIRVAPDRVEWFLIAAAVAMFATGAILLSASPPWWSWYVQLLDPWYWSWRAWTIALAILIEAIVLVRFYARNRRPQKAEDSDAAKRIAASLLLLLGIAGMVEAAIPWSDLRPFEWYWIRISFYWTRYWWIKLSIVAVLLVFLLLMLAIRTWLRSRQAGKLADVADQ